jgi:hypothetical protein
VQKASDGVGAFSVKSVWIIVGLLLLLTAGAHKARQRADIIESQAQLPRRRLLGLRNIWKALERTGPILAGLIALAATVYSAIGPFWPTPPDIEARDAADGSSAILPFKVSSKNHLFSVKNVSLSCYENLAFVMDADRKLILSRDWITQGGTSTLGDGVNYYCDETLKIQSNGSLLMGQSMATVGGIFRDPLTVIKLCVSVIGTYEDWRGIWRPLPKAMFQWPAAPGTHQWIKGPVVFEVDQSKWLPPNSTWGGAYGLRRLFDILPDGSRKLDPMALVCDWPKE